MANLASIHFFPWKVQPSGLMLDAFKKEDNGVANPPINRRVVERVKNAFAENDRRRKTDAQALRTREEDDLKRQILSIWNRDHTQTIPQIVNQLRLPPGYPKSNKKLGQLLRATIPRAEIEFGRKQSRLETALQRLERKYSGVKEQAQLESETILRPQASELRRIDLANKAEHKGPVIGVVFRASGRPIFRCLFFIAQY